MATNTYVALATQTLNSAVSSVTFSSIPQGYTDLRIVYSGTGSTTIPFALRFNGDSGSNYSYTILYGSGSSAASTRGSNQAEGYLGNVWTDQNTIIVDIMNYSNTTTYKTQISRANSAGNRVAAWVNLWRSTAAITEILVTATGGGTYQAGSTFTIYGIANADNFNKANGGVIVEDSTYMYHIFGGSGTFTPKEAITADILVIAGGGGGGNFGGGGGGAGGLLGFTSQSLTATNYTVTVGAGGAGAAANSALYGVAGSNSQFGALTACVGGGRGGGRATSSPGTTGGSGGGNAYSLGSLAGTSGQGYAGGAGTANGGGGGGGAGEAGNTDAVQGSGGDGVSTYSSWGAATGLGQNISGTYWFAGGGGGWGDNAVGGTGGDGGGGTGSSSATPSGMANTGGGGGATSQTIAAGNGGSGVVIIRYPK